MTVLPPLAPVDCEPLPPGSEPVPFVTGPKTRWWVSCVVILVLPVGLILSVAFAGWAYMAHVVAQHASETL